MIKKLPIYFSVIIVAIASIFWVNGLILAWVSPESPPPTDNVDTPIMGNWYPVSHGPNTSGGQHLLVDFTAQSDVTGGSYFTNLGGTNGIRIEEEGYYHIEFVALVYLQTAGDYGHVYLNRNGGYIDLDHGAWSTGATWEDRHCSWKGWVNAGDVIQANIYHQSATLYYWHAGPLYTRLTIEKIE